MSYRIEIIEPFQIVFYFTPGDTIRVFYDSDAEPQPPSLSSNSRRSLAISRVTNTFNLCSWVRGAENENCCAGDVLLGVMKNAIHVVLEERRRQRCRWKKIDGAQAIRARADISEETMGC